MQINDVKEKTKYINHLSDYVSHYFGFDYFDVSEKVFSSKNIIEEDKIKVLKIYKKNLPKKMKEEMMFYKKPIGKFRKSGQSASLGFNILNIDNALAEATLIKTAVSILKEEGYSKFFISLNAIGGKEAQKEWKKGLQEYYQDNISEIKGAELRKIKTKPEEIFFSEKEYLSEVNKNAPQPVEFLSESDIELFQKFIDYLEEFKIDYSVDSRMVGDKHIFSKTIFKIFANNPKTKITEEVGFGGRYDEEAKKISSKKKMTAVGLNIHFLKKNKKKIKLKEKEVDLHLLKIGSTADMKYFDVLEILSKLRVPVKFDVTEKKLSKQIEKVNDEDGFVLILGETEARADKILIRKKDNASQETIEIKDLEKYLKKFI